jgi:hypothetical protein
MTASGRSSTACCSASAATGSGWPLSRITKSVRSVIRPAGATRRVQMLPKVSTYCRTGTFGSVITSSGVSRSPSRSGRTLSMSIIGVGAGQS